MPRSEPSTVIARWATPNPHASLPVLARSLSTNRSATSSGRYLVHLRTLRLSAPPPPLPPATTNSKLRTVERGEGRTMYILRTLDGATEGTAIVVHDPSAPLRLLDNKGKRRALDLDDNDDNVDLAGSSSKVTRVGHCRWTYTDVASPHFSTTASSSSSIDSFIGRVLVAPPSSNAPGSVSSSSSSATTTTGGGQAYPSLWQARPTALSLEGGSFVISSDPVGAPNNADWLVKVAVVNVKGGTAGGTTRGCIVQATYLPMPYLPASSPLVREFLLSIFPPASIQNNEVSFIEFDAAEFAQAGILELGGGNDDTMDEEAWEWTDQHSLFT
ncbi:hypothetical protein JCM10212_001750, partial [Sporobolomyces blumeae]